MSTTKGTAVTKTATKSDAEVSRPEFRRVSVDDSTAREFASLLLEPQAHREVLGKLAQDITSGKATDTDVSVIFAGAEYVSTHGPVAQAVALALVSLDSRKGIQLELARVMGVSEGHVSRRVLLGKLALAGALPDGKVSVVTNAISSGTADFRKMVESGTATPQKVQRLAATVNRKAAERKAAKDRQAATPQTSAPGKSDTVATVRTALALISNESLARMSAEDVATLETVLTTAQNRIAAYRAKAEKGSKAA